MSPAIEGPDAIARLWRELFVLNEKLGTPASLFEESKGADYIESVQREQAIDLPVELRISLECFDVVGSAWGDREFDNVGFFGIDDVIEHYPQPTDPDRRIKVKRVIGPAKKLAYAKGRFTIGWGDYYLYQIDTIPAKGGVVGQILAIDHEAEEVRVIANSLVEFLQRGVDELKHELEHGSDED